jgi:opacity protein-like surface antigen
MSQAALAADLLARAPLVEAPLRGTVIPDESGFYLRGDIGVGATNLSIGDSFDSSYTPPAYSYAQKNIGDQVSFGIGAGYQFNSWFRADVTGEYRTSANYNSTLVYSAYCPYAQCTDLYSAKITSGIFLLNGYTDLGTWAGVTPFVGAGFGFATHKVAGLTDFGPQTGGFGYAGDKTSTKFAWALHAGLGYSITPNLKLELSYRYLNAGTADSGAINCLNMASSCGNQTQRYRISSNDFRLGLRYLFATAPAPAPIAVPVVAKY